MSLELDTTRTYVPPPPPPAPPETDAVTARIPDDGGEPAAPLPEPTATINGNSGDPLGRPTPDGILSRSGNRTSPQGAPVQSDPLFSNGNVEIRRERTYNVETSGGTATAAATTDQVVIETRGNGDDRVEVRANESGTSDVYVNGERYPVTLNAGQEITLRTGDGNDVILVGSDVRVNIVVDAGAGDDFIMTGAGNDRIDGGTGNDTVYAGAGRDDVFGNSGDDHISGGDGNDVVYGGDGNDFMTGTGGDDYLEGGAGNDTVWGGAGRDILSGGRDNDTLEGDGGDDTIYTGHGTDTVENSGGSDTVYGQAGEDTVSVGQHAQPGASNTVVNVVVSDVRAVTVEGSDAFRQRVEADIEMMRASPLGQQLLTDLDNSGRSVVIRETTDQNGYAGYTNPNDRFVRPDGQRGPGTDVQIGYNPSFHNDLRGSGYGFPVPAVTLYHELSHAWNGVTGTSQQGTHGEGVDRGQNNRERQAVGLPTTPPAGGANPVFATENGIRNEMGLPNRPSYAPS